MKLKVAIVGGGLSGLTAAIHLAHKGQQVTLFEKKTYPFHRVCGEYISNEVLPYLRSLGIDPFAWGAQQISEFELTSVNGKSARMPLDLGGFGISRFHFDHQLAHFARSVGVEVVEDCEVEEVDFREGRFHIRTARKNLEAAVVLAAHGKRSKFDYTLKREFISKRSPYVGVKYHLRTDHPARQISLHNFLNGYCGISEVENGVKNLCYLTHRDNVRAYGDLAAMEQAVLHRNPFLKRIFSESDFLFKRPEVINEITFESKEPVFQHMLMIGDSAGMITPLCGNGMAIGIHAAKLACEAVVGWNRQESARASMENTYRQKWLKTFAARLWAGRQIQRLFGGEGASNLAVSLARHVKPVARFLMGKTHGQPFA
jgi:flavin-dependent dehydrogenase